MFDTDIQQSLESWQVPDVAVGVIAGGKVFYARGFGLREKGRPEAVDTQTLFSIASLTKAFTATAFSFLVEEGRLSWDDPVVRYLPSFYLFDPYITERVTLLDLLCHRCGGARGRSALGGGERHT